MLQYLSSNTSPSYLNTESANNQKYPLPIPFHYSQFPLVLLPLLLRLPLSPAEAPLRDFMIWNKKTKAINDPNKMATNQPRKGGT
jgi:hypothetical protein